MRAVFLFSAYDEAAAIFERAGDDQSAGWNCFTAGQMTNARRMADRLLARGPSQPNDPDMLAAQAVLLACLGERVKAEKTYALFRSFKLDTDGDSRPLWILLRLGRNDEALALLEARLRGKKAGWRFAHFEARFDPRWDALRNDPRLAALLRETIWPEAKPLEEPKEPETSATKSTGT